MTIEQRASATTATVPVQQPAPAVEMPGVPSAPRFDAGPTHAHTGRCYWDYLECRWQCPPDR